MKELNKWHLSKTYTDYLMQFSSQKMSYDLPVKPPLQAFIYVCRRDLSTALFTKSSLSKANTDKSNIKNY